MLKYRGKSYPTIKEQQEIVTLRQIAIDLISRYNQSLHSMPHSRYVELRKTLEKCIEYEQDQFIPGLERAMRLNHKKVRHKNNNPAPNQRSNF
jgi:hypothetical protein